MESEQILSLFQSGPGCNGNEGVKNSGGIL